MDLPIFEAKSSNIESFNNILPLNNRIIEPIYNKENTFLLNQQKIFTKNQGQIDNDDIKFYIQDMGLWFTKNNVFIEIREETENKCLFRSDEFDFEEENEQYMTKKYDSIILNQIFLRSNPVEPKGKNSIDYHSNFFYGADSNKWVTNVPNFQEIYYKNIYDHIDLRYYFNDQGLKYDFIIHPGANINQIRIKYEGADQLKLDNNKLIIKNPIKDLIDCGLFVYQKYNNNLFSINSNFKIYSDFQYGFELMENYNQEETLIIDPLISLEFSTYIGGNGYDIGSEIAIDSESNTFVTGYTDSTKFPTKNANDTSHNGDYDCFILKLNPSGSNIIYSTYIGGNDADYAIDICVNKVGNAFITGRTFSSNFPTTSGANDTSYNNALDCFVVKLNSNGSQLCYSTFIGGSNDDNGEGISIDINGNVFVTGYTKSNDFPTTQNAYNNSFSGGGDIFLFKLNSSGSTLIYSTYIGGNDGEIAHEISIDSMGNAFVTGWTYSTDFPTTTGVYNQIHNGETDCFIFRLNQSGKTLDYSTLIGGDKWDYGYGIDLDLSGNAYITGYTLSSNFPTIVGSYSESFNGGSTDVFIIKLNKNGSKLIYSTFVGGSNNEYSRDIVIDMNDCALITGYTTSFNFPTTENAFDNITNGLDGFVVKLGINGSKLNYSSYLGGSNDDKGEGISIDSDGNAYITGITDSLDFPNTTGAFNISYSGGSDAFVSKITFQQRINVTSLELISNNKPINVIYSKFDSYTFRINITDTVSLIDLDQVQLILDPSGSNIRISWNRITKQFLELSDPYNYISISSSSKALNNSIQRWTIDFDIVFNWNYPDEDLHGVQVFATSTTLSPVWLNATKVYRIENDLIFNGTLEMRNENDKLINVNDLVKGSEVLNISGLTVVYENTTDIYPPDNEFNVTIKDDYANQWIDSPTSGEPFSIELNTPNITYIDGYNYSIEIIDIPMDCDKSNETFSIRIDANNVTFSDFIPDNSTWHIDNEVIVGNTITDHGGGEVNGSIITHSISNNNGITWGNWQLVPNVISAESIEIKDTVTLNEGSKNLIKWRAWDSLGNGPSESEHHRILVDTEGVVFSNAWPMTNDVSLTENVSVGITISDTTSGVNASSIEYSISMNKGYTWTSWKLVEGLNDSSKIDVQLNITLLNGTNNMLKWRAKDIAGNDFVETPPLSINVNTWTPPIIPEISIISPLNAITINSTSVNLSWALIDPNIKNVTYDILFDINNPPGMFRSELMNTSYKIIDLTDGQVYYWRIRSYKDRELRNSFESDVYWFKVELPIPFVEIYNMTITGPGIISLYQGDRINVSLTITNLGNSDDIIKIMVQENNISGYIQLDNYSYLQLTKGSYGIRNLEIVLPNDVPPGTYDIIITAISIKSNEKIKNNHTVLLQIKEVNGIPNGDGIDQNGDSQDKGEGSDFLLLASLGIIIIIIILTILFIILRKKKKEADKLASETSFTTKPIPTQVINVGETQPQAVQASIPEPVQSEAPNSALQQSQAVTTPSSPTVAQQLSERSPETLAQVPSILQTDQKPQLPPAQNLPTTDEPSQIIQDTSITTTPTLTVATEPSEPSQPSTTVTPKISQLTNSTPPTPKSDTFQPIPTITTTTLDTPTSSIPMQVAVTSQASTQESHILLESSQIDTTPKIKQDQSQDQNQGKKEDD